MLQQSIIKKPTKKKTSHSDNEVYNEVVLISEQICYFLIYCRATERPFKSKNVSIIRTHRKKFMRFFIF